MTQWACEYRASERARRALQNFLCGWCFNFQSVWVNNVWLSVPLLALTVSCLNLIAHRAWGSGWVARVWVWGFLYLHNGASQSLFCIGELWTKLIYQALWTNGNFQGCTEGSPEVAAAFPTHCTLRLYSHFLHTGIRVQLNKRERKLTGEKENSQERTQYLSTVMYTEFHSHSPAGGLAHPHSHVTPQFLIIAVDMDISQGWQQLQEKASWGLFPEDLWDGLFLFLLSVFLLEKVRWCRAGKFKLLRGQWAQGWVSDSKQFRGVQDNIWLSQRLMTMEKKFANIPSSFLQDLS